MIALDYSAVSIASIMMSIKLEGEKLTKEFALHMILNSIRASNKRFKKEFGKMVICCDAAKNWRKDAYKYYKYKRRKDRKESDVDWDLIYECLEFVKNELKNGFPYIIIECENAEADDVIGALAVYASENGEPTVIVSNDKDFVQLHTDMVCQYRPCESAFVRHPNPSLHLRELILRGDKDDGIPNIKSADDIFTIEGKKQKSMFKKDMELWLVDDKLSFLTDETKDNYARNERLIDLSFTPEEIRQDAVNQYVTSNVRPNKPKMTKFFMKNRLRYLHEKINDFM